MSAESKVGPAVPAVAALSCTYSSKRNLDGDYCGATAVLHGLIDAGAEDDGSPSSTLACAAHADTMAALAFTSHQVGGDCCLPGTYIHWEPDAEGVVRSWCTYPDEDPSLTLAVHVAVAVPVGADKP